MRHVSLFIFAVLLMALVPAEAGAQWSMIGFVDEFGEDTGSGARSATVKPIRSMSFPYHDVEATIFVNCNRAWIRFTEAPNLTDGDISDGYTSYNISVRLDKKDTVRWRVRQSWGDKDLRFNDSTKTISALSSGSSLAVSLPWYGQGNVAFRWSLNGSTHMIKNSCK